MVHFGAFLPPKTFIVYYPVRAGAPISSQISHAKPVYNEANKRSSIVARIA